MTEELNEIPVANTYCFHFKDLGFLVSRVLGEVEDYYIWSFDGPSAHKWMNVGDNDLLDGIYRNGCRLITSSVPLSRLEVLLIAGSLPDWPEGDVILND